MDSAGVQKWYRFWHGFGKYPVRISAGTPTVFNEILRGFLQSLKSSARICIKFGHNRFLTLPFQCIILYNPIIRRYVVSLTASLNEV
jgi:hypothetical protein